MRRHILGVAALLALVLPTFAQQQQPFGERVDVNAVLLDVIVTDAGGHQILGLGKDDFIVKENGVEQTIDSVDYFTSRVLLDAREENAPFDVERVREERYFIFFFDKPQDAPGLTSRLMLARNAVKRFIAEEMREHDRVAIVGHDVRLKVYSDFTNDRRQLERALTAALRFGKGIAQPAPGDDPSILRAIDRGEMMRRTGTVYEALDALADALQPIPVRKNLIMFSPGIVGRHETVRNGIIVDRSHHLDPAIESLNAANVSVYPLQLQDDIDMTPLFHQRLSEIAEATGGRYVQFAGGFESALDRIEAENAGYYLITYRSRQPRGESGFQKVDVTVRDPRLRVVARPGYQIGG